MLASLGENVACSESQTEYDYSIEYWAGWILAYYQWKTGSTFRSILDRITMQVIIRLYPTLHEASEEKCADTLDAIIARQNKPTKLQMQRKIYGYSQRELADKSGVNLRTLQQYELGTKDIRKASASTIVALANTLGCGVEDII